MTKDAVDIFNSVTQAINAGATVLLVVTGAFAILYVSKQIGESQKQAQIQHLLTLTRQYEEAPITNIRKVAASAILVGNTAPSELYDILNFFEEVGLLVHRGYLNASDVWEMFGYHVFPLYHQALPMIEDDRKDDPNAFTHFLKLYENLRGIERENEGKTDAQSPEAITDYWEGETLSSVGTSVPRRRRSRRLSKGAAAGHTV